MASPLLQLRVRAELLARVDAAAGGAGMDRKTWVVRALEAALESSLSAGSSERQVSAGSTFPASPRAPVGPLSNVGPRQPDLAALARMRRLER